MKLRILFTTATLRQLRTFWKQAYDRGDVRLVRRLSALLAYGQGQEVAWIATDLSVAAETVYQWLRALVVDREASLGYRRASGRPTKLTKSQKRRLGTIIEKGSLASGFTSACWSSLLIQEVILKEFGVLYNRHYVCELLDPIAQLVVLH